MLPNRLAGWQTHWRRMPRASRAELRAWQDLRVRRLIQHAAGAVPFWRMRFEEAGVAPESIRGVADLGRLPVTDKAALLAARAGDLLARGVAPASLVSKTTSGSSGEPFTIYRTLQERRRLHLLRLRAYRLQGARLTDRVVRIGTPPPPKSSLWPVSALRRAARERWATVSTFLPPEEMLARIRDCRPDVIGGYPGVLDLLADHLTTTGRRDLRPRLLATGAEVLTGDMRQRIEHAFQAPLLQTYGASEFDLLAWECPVGRGLHLCEDGAIIELLRPDGTPAAPGEQGEVVVTNLHAFAMPFIRYRLGDLATATGERCPCGLPFAVVHQIEGRVVDYLHLPDGTALHPYRLLAPLARGEMPWVRRYQLVQQRSDRLVLRVMVTPEAAPGDLVALESALNALLPHDAALLVEQVDSLPFAASGKFRLVQSLANPGGTLPLGAER